MEQVLRGLMRCRIVQIRNVQTNGNNQVETDCERILCVQVEWMLVISVPCDEIVSAN